MPLQYTGSSGIFTHLGKIIARANSYGPIAATTLTADLATLVAAFGTTWLPEEGVASFYGGLEDNVTAWRQGLARFADSRLLDPATVLTQFSAPLDVGSGLDQVLAALVRQMILDGQTVRACRCTAGPVTALAANAGNGQAYLDLMLDGWNAPVLGAAPLVWYAGQVGQFCVGSETMTLECIADSAMDGVRPGDEVWSWTGAPAYPDLDWHAEGSGNGPALRTDNGGTNLLVNGDMEVFSGNVPVGWQLIAGTAGLNMFADTLPQNVFRGTAAAAFAGDALSNIITLVQPMPVGLLQGKRRYRVTLAAKQTFANSAGSLRAFFVGDGYIAGDGIDVSLLALTGTYSLLSFTTTIPAPVPANFQLAITVSGLPAGGSVWVDSVSLAPLVYHGGVAASVAAGNLPWLRGDRLTFPVTNDGAGQFQTFFRRHYLTQLPSVQGPPGQGTALTLPFLLLTSSGLETIPEGLVV